MRNPTTKFQLVVLGVTATKEPSFGWAFFVSERPKTQRKLEAARPVARLSGRFQGIFLRARRTTTKLGLMRGSEFDEVSFFSAVETSGSRALLIGRRAMVVLGLPVLTADYDFWVHSDDIEKLNAAARAFDLEPNRTPNDARRNGRYVLENDEHVDVLVSATRTTVDGLEVVFDDLWSRRVSVEIGAAKIFIPSVDDLILTKRIGGRPKDAEDIRLLQRLKEVQK